MASVTVLAPGPMMDVIMQGLDANFDVIRLWLEDEPDAVLAERAGDIRAIANAFVPPIDAALMGRLPRLEIVSNFGVGYDPVDTKEAARRGIVVTNTPDVLTEEVADTAMGLLTMTVRELPQSERWLRAGKWLEKPYPLTRGTLRDRTLGIVGLGRIGKAIAARAEAHGMPIAYHGRNRQEGVEYRYYGDLLDMARAVDTLMLVTPGGAETRRMIGRDVLEALGPRGILINVARGSVVDEAALVEALRAGTIQAAGLDVFEDEPNVPQALIEMDNVVLLPHVASGSVHTRNAMGRLVVDNLVAWFETGQPLTPVPETPVPAAR